jgi:hypothetical protein
MKGKKIKVGDVVIAEYPDGDKFLSVVVDIGIHAYFFDGDKAYWNFKDNCTKSSQQIKIEI